MEGDLKATRTPTLLNREKGAEGPEDPCRTSRNNAGEGDGVEDKDKDWELSQDISDEAAAGTNLDEESPSLGGVGAASKP